jgi:hypothetical protein
VSEVLTYDSSPPAPVQVLRIIKTWNSKREVKAVVSGEFKKEERS